MFRCCLPCVLRIYKQILKHATMLYVPCVMTAICYQAAVTITTLTMFSYKETLLGLGPV